jgi:alanine dehydrogenase
MRIAIPKEIKPLEGRVGLVPEACAELIEAGHRVAMETGAGIVSGFGDQAYRALGVAILPDARSVYRFAELLVKVKEPLEPELELLERRHLLFCFLHLAANAELKRRLLEIGLTAVGFETVEEGGELPILAPMSDIAGRIAVQVGTHLLHRPQGGKGLLLGGLPGAPRGKVVVLGAGKAGGNAVRVAAALGAEVVVFDRRRGRLEEMRGVGDNVSALFAYPESLVEAVAAADLLIGAVLVAGARAPRLVSARQVAGMQPGSVVVDVSVDQGGCIETTRPTTYADPVYQEHKVTHFCVTNMPGAVPRSASLALSAAVLPCLLRLAAGALDEDASLRAGINVRGGAVVHPALQYPLS